MKHTHTGTTAPVTTFGTGAARRGTHHENIPIWLDISFVLLVCVIFASIGLFLMATKSRIASIDTCLANLNSENENLKSVIENEKSRLANLINHKVVELAKQNKMSQPAPGQVYVVRPEDFSDSDYQIAPRNLPRKLNIASAQQPNQNAPVPN